MLSRNTTMIGWRYATTRVPRQALPSPAVLRPIQCSRSLSCVRASVSTRVGNHGVSLLQPSVVRPLQLRRHFWRMLNAVFNRPDHDRIKEVGVERACAEWLLRCGAHVRWVGSDRFHTDYNTLPPGKARSFMIEEINGDEAAVMDIGFEHFEGLKALRKIRFHHCLYLEDGAIQQLGRVKVTLESLELSSCGDVSDDGLRSLAQLSNLKHLKLVDLPNVRDKAGCLQFLTKALPSCSIEFTDVTQQEEKQKG